MPTKKSASTFPPARGRFSPVESVYCLYVVRTMGSRTMSNGRELMVGVFRCCQTTNLRIVSIRRQARSLPAVRVSVGGLADSISVLVFELRSPVVSTSTLICDVFGTYRCESHKISTVQLGLDCWLPLVPDCRLFQKTSLLQEAGSAGQLHWGGTTGVVCHLRLIRFPPKNRWARSRVHDEG